VIRSLTPADIDAVVDLHLRAFPTFFLSFLGPRFLRHFYASFTWHPDGIALVAVRSEDGAPLGVIAGPLIPEGFFGTLVRHRWWAFAAASFAVLLKRPLVAPRLLRAIRYRGQPPPGVRRALLSTIAVSPEAQRRGIGRALLTAWLDAVRARGAKGAYLTTDAAGNESINRFYLRSSWTLGERFVTREGRHMNRYVFDFKSGA
jgi:GNAT superfamily N-acetyltransferase